MTKPVKYNERAPLHRLAITALDLAARVVSFGIRNDILSRKILKTHVRDGERKFTFWHIAS